MKELLLPSGHTVIIDLNDYNKIKGYRLSMGPNGYVRIHLSKGNKKKTYLHRFIMDEPVGEVDHKDLNKLDCRRQNLRCATNSENNQNKEKILTSNSTSKYKGVDYRSSRNKWRARIGFHDIKIYIGQYNTAEEAARAYDKEALVYYGIDARLNFKKEDYL